MKKKLAFLSVILCLLTSYARSQSVDIPLGGWKDYLSYQQGLTVCQGGNNIYCCCSSGVFYYNTSDNSITRYNKVTGLSDIGCTVARYNSLTGTLVIGYSNGNVDLVTPTQIINIPDLKNNLSPGSKTINNIYFNNDTAYLSCGQGIMVIDLYQDIILDLYKIGPLGGAINVYSTTIFNDTLFAATQTGVYKISHNNPYPEDYANWSLVTQRLPSGIYNGIANCGNKMYASLSRRLMASTYLEDTIYVYQAGIWSVFHTGDNVYSLGCSIINNSPYMVYTGAYNAASFDPAGNLFYRVNNYGFSNNVNPNDAFIDNNTNMWIADATLGLVKCSPSSPTGQNFIPPGPYSNDIFDMQASGSNLYIAPGGYLSGGVQPLYRGNVGISELSDNTWYRLTDNGSKDTIFDLCVLAIDPTDPLHAYAGSFNNGVVEYNNHAITNVYGTYNSTLSNYYKFSGYSVRVAGVGFDTNSNLWVSNSDVGYNYLSVKKKNGTWQTFYFDQVLNTPLAAHVTKLLVTKSGAKWIIVPGGGILAYQDNGTFASPTNYNSVYMNSNAGNGNLPSLNVYCLTEDQNGAIWVGTDTRVVVFYSPDNVFNGPGGWDAQNVYVQQTGYTQYLMQNQFTTSIVVDGGNRKWIGTLGGGVFLMSADGTQQLLNFTTSNSPLLSNNILCMAIDQITGEVFFGTDEGVVSYRGTSTEGGTTFSNVYAYPDPVPHNYTGPIAIKNLVANSDIKIATVSGEIVYHTTALGGQAIWYGTNFSGTRVQTGVYLVFCTSPDGTQSVVTKLLLEN
ncbi:MAG TPA: two-component regulator propeller domain-containing protein [Bacteroidia bacterium]|jgi:hypothetical protein|nr:two-component regulator propeller domain-containing protein [Bacteroidia bacterium]